MPNSRTSRRAATAAKAPSGKAPRATTTGRTTPAKAPAKAVAAEKAPRVKAAKAKPIVGAEPVTRVVKAAKGAKSAKAVKAGKTAVADGRGKSLVIVESPTKSRTLTKFLGRGFSVLASNGHIMDLPKSELGVDLDNDFEPQYVPIRGKTAALAKIREAAKKADRIFLAPDPDREGEAIAWHLAGALKSAKRPISRLTFNEITERAVKLALEHPRELDMNLVNAQQARRVLDRLVGYKVSPFVWRTVRYGLSAGRVQSVALRLICEREEAIRQFVPVEYWTIEVDYQTPTDERFTARLVRVGDEELEQGQLRGDGVEERARSLARELEGAAARVTSVETTPRLVHPRAPFITSTLQQTAFNRLGYTAKRTMALAQQLYEGVALGSEGSVGLITYMRTDAPRLAGEAIAEIRDWLAANLGAEYVPESPRQYKSKKGAQEAHEGIRPSSVARTPEAVRPHLTDEQFKLYDLIWKRAVACQTASAEYLQTTLEVESGRLGLRASGRVLKFAGFQKLYGVDEEDDAAESQLPEIQEGVSLTVAPPRMAEPAPPVPGTPGAEASEIGGEAAPAEPVPAVRPDQHFTQPPPRYTEASLVRSLEEENIGRPSTYATIVTTIVDRQYVTRDKGRLAPTDLGEAVNRLLTTTFPDVFQVEFTARMEEELDGIEEGKQEWHSVVHDFWGPFSKDLDQAEKSSSKHRKKVEEITDIACPTCGKMLVKKFGRRGPFLACPGYPECKYTRPVDDAELPTPVEGTCDLCGSPLVSRNGPYGRFISCSRRPDCKFTKPITLGIKCPDCGLGEIAERRTRRGKTFYGCTRYPECTFAAWDRPKLVPCPNCGAPFLVEKETKKAGLVLRCIKCKSTFAPETVGA
ncbi:MAG TPA: type I DNA topoisomerase [Candidatus Eisenbacteria bacterium]|nr:type I DNA topoisomerase [Candidatus Eisenbacteria bacterium]